MAKKFIKLHLYDLSVIQTWEDAHLLINKKIFKIQNKIISFQTV